MNRHIKSFLTFTGGAVTGLIFGGAGVIVAELSSERIRHALTEAFCDWLFPEKKRKVTYTSYYDNKRSPKDKPMFIPFTEAVYALRVDAENFADKLEDIADRYGIVALSDYYELAGLENKNGFNSDMYGWSKREIRGAEIKTRHYDGYDGYYVALQMPTRLKK